MWKINLIIVLCALSTTLQAQYTLTSDDVAFSNGVITNYYNHSERDIIIPSSINGVAVTAIGEYGFYQDNLTSVVFPDVLTSIGWAAFSGNQLTTVTFGDGLTSIDDWAFENNDLTTVTFGDGIKSIKEGVFAHNALTSVSLPESVTSIGEYAFYYNDLTSVTFPESLTSIGPNAFDDNELSVVTFPEGLTSIGPSAFSRNQLASVTFPEGITSIGQSAFSRNQLTSIAFSDGAMSIDRWAFSDNELTSVTFSDGLTRLESNVFYENPLTSVIFGDSTSIGADAFRYNELTSITFKDGATSIGENAFVSSEFTSLTFGNGSTSIEKLAFENVPLTSVTFGDGITSIEGEAFYRSSLVSLTFGDGTISIGNKAFSENQLTSLTFGDGTISIGDHAFSQNQLTSVTFPPEVTSIGKHAFFRNALTTVNLPFGLTSLEDLAFYDNELTSVTFSEGLDSIGSAVFYSNKLTSVTFPDGLSFIGQSAFSDNKISSVIFPESLTSIEDFAFSSNELTSVTFPDGLTSISEYAFRYNELSSVTFPHGLTSIGSSAFSNNQLASVSFPDGLTSIGNYAFEYNELPSVTLPDVLKSIGRSAFSANELTSFSLPGQHYLGYTDTWSDNIGALYNNGTTVSELTNSYDRLTEDYEITYSLDGGTNDDTNPTGYTILTETIALSAATKDDLTFIGWYTEADFTNQIIEVAQGSTGDIALFAKFLTTYDISYSLNGGTNVTSNPATYTEEDQTITLAAAMRAGYAFEGWYTEAEFTNQITEIANGSSIDLELFAKFSDALTYDISYALDGGTNDSTNPSTYTVESATITLAVVTKEHYTFEGWYLEAEFINTITEIALGSAGAITLYARFDPFDYDITYILDGATNNDTNPATYSIESATITLADATKGAYTFEGWYLDFKFTNLVTEIAQESTGAITLYARLDAVDYDITYSLDGGTNNDTNPANYSIETRTIILADATKDGFIFEGWYLDSDFTNQITVISRGNIGSIALYAKFSVTLSIDIENQKAFSFYPNPSAYFIYTDSQIADLKIKVINMSGRIVRQFEKSATSYDISSLAAGTYTIVATDSQGATYASKLIKK